MDVHFPDGPDDLVTWIASEPAFMERASHAIVVDGGTWLVDPVDHPLVRARLDGLPPVAGVLQLLDRHGRDCARVATAFGVPLHVTPALPVDGAPFRVITLQRGRFWTESALWMPDRRCMVVAEAVGTVSYFRAPGQRVGVHPMARVSPPRALVGYPAAHLLVGHGAPVHDAAAGRMVDQAVARARTSTARWALSMLTGSVRREDRARPNLDG